jgi:hypothetical protein
MIGKLRSQVELKNLNPKRTLCSSYTCLQTKEKSVKLKLIKKFCQKFKHRIVKSKLQDLPKPNFSADYLMESESRALRSVCERRSSTNTVP